MIVKIEGKKMSRSSSVIYEENPPSLLKSNGNHSRNSQPPTIDVYGEKSEDSEPDEASLNEDGTAVVPSKLIVNKFGFLIDPQVPVTRWDSY